MEGNFIPTTCEHCGQALSHRNTPELFEIVEDRLHTTAGSAFISPTEEKILAPLIQRPQALVSFDSLISSVWTHTITNPRHTLLTHLANIRKKIEPLGWTIQNVRGRGVRLAKL